MRLTPDLLYQAPNYLNALKDREIILRGHRIPLIENLAITKDLNDTIDLTDNDIRIVGNFPKMLRLKSLLLAQNRISSIQLNVSESIPNLETLILTANTISQLADIDALSGFQKLTFLSLLDNPITNKEYYRLYVIWRLPELKILDFEKIKKIEREQAERLFGSIESPTDLALKIIKVKTVSSKIEVDKSSVNLVKLTEEDKKKFKESLKHATSLEEIDRIEKILKMGGI